MAWPVLGCFEFGASLFIPTRTLAPGRGPKQQILDGFPFRGGGALRRFWRLFSYLSLFLFHISVVIVEHLRSGNKVATFLPSECDSGILKSHIGGGTEGST